jgi:hypothetical protein
MLISKRWKKTLENLTEMKMTLTKDTIKTIINLMIKTGSIEAVFKATGVPRGEIKKAWVSHQKTTRRRSYGG